MKHLNQILDQLEIISITGNPEVEVSSVVTDSRKATPGSLFVALTGVQVDGHAYIDNALELGASIIISEKEIDNKKEGITYVLVKDTADAIGKIATHWYDNPSTKVNLVGVTGTNGKTTTATLLFRLFRKLGYSVGLLSTVANYIDDKVIPATHTTPDPLSLNEILHQMVEAGCEYVFMEVSSHAIHQKRISGLEFDGAIFSNLTQDHLDYHKTMAEYLKVKKSFFDHLPSSAFALTNADEKNGMVMVQNTKATVHTYGVLNEAEFRARILETRFTGSSITINNRELEVFFVGVFNVYNILSVYASAILLGQNQEEVLTALSTLKPVSGRFETIYSPNGYTVVVDYAHTPDALENVLSSIDEVLEQDGHIITVVGCGGNRDRTKRPLMAQVAAKFSSQLILTSDNPRYEEPMAIINDMADGLSSQENQKTLLIEDRKQAIRTACMLAKPKDVILIAGKGHEDYQDIKGVKHHFSDQEIVKEIFKA